MPKTPDIDVSTWRRRTSGLLVPSGVAAEQVEGAERRRRRPFVLGAEIVTLAGALAYAIVREAYGSYYENFGLRPDDLGLDFGGILATAAVGLVVETALLAVVYALLALPVMVIKVPLAAFRNARHRRWLLAGSLAASFAVPLYELWLLHTQHIGAGIPRDADGIVALEGVVALVLVLALVSNERDGDRWADLDAWLTRRAAWMWIAVAAAGVAVLFALSKVGQEGFRLADERGAAARSGQAFVGAKLDLVPDHGPVTMLDVQAQVARVRALAKEAAAAVPQQRRCLLLLGRNGGTAFLWNVQAKRVVRLPEALYAITTVPDTNC